MRHIYNLLRHSTVRLLQNALDMLFSYEVKNWVLHRHAFTALTFTAYEFTVYSNDQKPAVEPEGSIGLLGNRTLQPFNPYVYYINKVF